MDELGLNRDESITYEKLKKEAEFVKILNKKPLKEELW